MRRKKIACATGCARTLTRCPQCPPARGPHSLGQLHLDLLPDLLPLLVAADGEDVPVLQLLLAGSVPELHGQQLLPDPAGEGPCGEGTVAEGSDTSGCLGHREGKPRGCRRSFQRVKLQNMTR